MVVRSCAVLEEAERARPLPHPFPGRPRASEKQAPAFAVGSAPAASGPATGTGQPPQILQENPQMDLHRAGKKVEGPERSAQGLYLSNDDSMSLASAQRILYAIENFLPVYRNEIRPHEFLNYFQFQTLPVEGSRPFSVKLDRAERENGMTVALAVQGRTLSLAERRPAVLTLVVDKSGSMAAQGKMEYLREGLKLLKAQLKDGDVLNIVEFDHEVCNAVEGMTVGRDGWSGYDRTVDELAPRGSTDLHAGLVEGYRLAEKFRDAGKINRVLLITDAIANTGELSPELMASIGKYYDTQRIGLSGIGVGLDFNDELLDTLTERGKGAYLFLGLRDALPKVFGAQFVSLLETVARDVHFHATFPKGLNLDVFYGEEVSTDKSKVQAIHYFAGSSQLFLLDLKGKPENEKTLSLKIEYTDPVTLEAKSDSFPFTLADAAAIPSPNVAKARLLMAFAGLLEQTSLPGSRPYNDWSRRFTPEPTLATEGKKKCTDALAEMTRYRDLATDAESAYALQLAQKYCARF
jgi:Ca-activated chloride channel family protein